MGPFRLRSPLAQQQKAGAITHHIVDRVGQHLKTVLLGSLQRRHGGTEAATRHHSRRIRGGTRGKLQRAGQVVAQPLAALGQRLGMGENLAYPFQRATTQQGMADRQNQSPSHPQLRVLPKGIHARGHPAFHRVLHRDHRGVAASFRQGLHHSADAHLRQQLWCCDGL